MKGYPFVYSIDYIIEKIMISGKEFNELYKGVSFVKLTNENCVHNGFTFKEGLNVDVLELNPKGECELKGLRFCKFIEVDNSLTE